MSNKKKREYKKEMKKKYGGAPNEPDENGVYPNLDITEKEKKGIKKSKEGYVFISKLI